MQHEKGIDDHRSGDGILQHPSHRKCNKDLTEEERIANRELKRHLKQLAKQKKLETRVRHAIARRDPEVEEQARAELADLLLESQQHRCHAGEASFTAQTVDESELETECRTIIESTYHQLQLKLQKSEQEHQQGIDSDARGTSDDSSVIATTSTRKDVCLRQTVVLLRNMTKGTQELTMFDNQDALRGYTRQKFIERSMLVVSSLCKLFLQSSSAPTHAHLTDTSTQQSAFFRVLLLDRLQGIKSVASIGCGPGCDAFGISVLFSCCPTPATRVERIILLDWAMDQWSFIVKPLEELVVPQYADSIECGTCNVLKHLDDSENAQALHLMANGAHWAQHEQGGGDDDHDDMNMLSIDLFVTSYLLSETRGKWQAFYESLFRKARPGSLFLFSDPTAWQIHIWLSKYQSELEGHCWLDSSMNRPDLEVLEGRLGPGVLLAMKKV
jgi:hypothetical protein